MRQRAVHRIAYAQSSHLTNRHPRTTCSLVVKPSRGASPKTLNTLDKPFKPSVLRPPSLLPTPRRAVTRGGGAFFLTGFAADCSSHPSLVRGRSHTAASIASNPCARGETNEGDTQGHQLWGSSCIPACTSTRHTCQTVRCRYFGP